MSEERKMKILLPTLIGTAFLNMVIFIVYLIQKHSTEVISFFIQMFFLCCFFATSYIVGLVILKIFRKWKEKQ